LHALFGGRSGIDCRVALHMTASWYLWTCLVRMGDSRCVVLSRTIAARLLANVA
jgi:hypothetical protein